jgi:hypothetical protein
MAPDGALRRKDDVWSRPVGDRAVLYSWDAGKAIVLNTTGAVLWEALKTPRTAAELGDILVDRFPGLPVERARADAGAYLERLFEENLLRSEPRAPSVEVGKTIDLDIGG